MAVEDCITQRMGALETQMAALLAQMETLTQTVADFPPGPQGEQGEDGTDGADGEDGDVIFTIQAGEVGVVDNHFPWGHGERFGIIPDGTTIWETTHSAQVTAWLDSCILLGVPCYLLPGDYNTSFNLTADWDGIILDWDGVVLNGILHFVGISNVWHRGTTTVYDRFGITASGSENIRVDTIICASDSARNIAAPGKAGRGCHIVFCEDFQCNLIKVLDTGITDDSGTGDAGNLAAIFIENQNCVRGNLRGRYEVENCQGNGIYINCINIDVELSVKGYGAAAIDCGNGLEGSNSIAQCNQGIGVWLNRCTGEASISLSQSNASPVSDTIAVLFDETGISTKPEERMRRLQVHKFDVEVGDGNRGVCIGDPAFLSPLTQVHFAGEATIRLRAAPANTLESGYGALNLSPTDGASQSFRNLTSADHITFVGLDVQPGFMVTSAAGTDNYLGLDVKLRFPNTSNNQLVNLNGASGTIRGRVDVHANRITGGSTATPAIYMNATRSLTLQARLSCTVPTSTPALQMVNCVGCTVDLDSVNYGRASFGAVNLEANNYCRLSFRLTGVIGSTLEGVRFKGIQTGCIYQDWDITGFDKGLENDTGMAFVACAAIACNIHGCTDPTDIPIADLPDTIACVDFTA